MKENFVLAYKYYKYGIEHELQLSEKALMHYKKRVLAFERRERMKRKKKKKERKLKRFFRKRT